MSFTLNRIAQRLGGGFITRTRTVDSTEITVGRGSDCDIQLQDLAVSLRHAVIRQIGPSEVNIESSGREPFRVDGRFVTKADLKLDGEHRLIFGSHSLTLSAGEASGDIAITVTREAVSSPAAADDEDRIFSIRDRMFGKRMLAWTFGLLIIAVGLAWPIVGYVSHQNARIHADQQWSGAPLSQSHSFLGKNCQACHVKAFVAVRDDACLACHRVGHNQAEREAVAAKTRDWGGPVAADLIRGHAAPGRLLAATPLPNDFGGKIQAVFRRTFNHPNDRCASCHLEHIDSTGVAASGREAAVRAIPALVPTNTCVDCHSKLKARLGDTRLLDTADWARHPDFRPLITTSPGLSGPHGPSEPRLERMALSGQARENNGLRFSHQIHLAPLGGVARMAQELGSLSGYGGALSCSACHRPDASGKGFAPIDMVRDCSNCHSLAFARVGGALQMLPHGHPDQVVSALRAYTAAGGGTSGGRTQYPGFMPVLRSALEQHTGPGVSTDLASVVKTTFTSNCGECHTVLKPSDPASLAYRIAPVSLNDRYLPRGAFNHGVPAHYKDAHGQPTCTTCHAARTSDSADQVLLPHLAQCATCHGKTPKQTPLAASGDCAECHSYHAPGDATPKGVDQQHLMPANAPIPAIAFAETSSWSDVRRRIDK